VLDDEGVGYADDALWLLARAADGSMRDALSLTDQAIAYGGGELDAGSVSRMLGTINRADVFRILEALIGADGQSLLAETERIADFSPDYSTILADLLDVFHRIALEQAVPDSTDNAQGDMDAVRELAGRLSPEDVQLFYQMALIARRDLEITPDAHMGFEMALLRMLAFRPGTGGEPPNGVSGASGSDSSREESGEPESEAGSAALPASDPDPGPSPDAEQDPEPLAAGHDFDWCRDFDSLGLQGMPETLAANASCHREGDGWVLTMASGHYQLLHKRHGERIRDAVRVAIGSDARVEFREGDPMDQTPVAFREHRAAERRESAVTAIRGDPVVQQIVERFEGQVIEDSIQPLDPAPSESRAS